MRYRVSFYSTAPFAERIVEADDVNFYGSFVAFSNYPLPAGQSVRIAAFNNSDVESVELVDGS